jgi:hypothetical protein
MKVLNGVKKEKYKEFKELSARRTILLAKHKTTSLFLMSITINPNTTTSKETPSLMIIFALN